MSEEFEVIQDAELQAQLAGIQDDNYDFLDKELDFEKDGKEYESLRVPDEQVLRPFFFMRLIQKSIAEGAFLTEFLFVPKAVWTQERF